VRRLVAIASLAVLLAGCGEETKYPKYETDYTRFHAYFIECMNALPAGPAKTQYNDWDEVVEACRYASAQQSRYCYENCPPQPVALLAKHGGAQ